MEIVKKKVEANKKQFEFLRRTEKRINILYGSADSGKSWSIGQHLLFNKFLAEDKVRLLVARGTGPALKRSCWLLMNDLRMQYDLPVKINKSELTMSTNGNTIFFVPLDDVEKLKSLEQPNYVWVNEATELTYKDYLQLNVRCRGNNSNGINQLFFDFNPIDENSFWKDIVENPPENVAVLHCTCEDNRFANPDDIAELDRLKEQDPVYYKIYRLGIWASPTNIIYTNWDIVDEWPEDDWFDEIIYGVDFGTTNPSAIIEIGIKDWELWEREILYETGLSPSMFLTRLEDLDMDKNRPIYADSAMPGMITDMENNGWLVYPSKKGQNSVFEGIRKVKDFRIHMHSDSVNLKKERKGYKLREDRNGNAIEGNPVKFRDHLMDGERYAIFTHFDDTGTFRVVC